MEEQTLQVQEDKRTVADFFDAQEKEYLEAIEKVKANRTLASSMGLLNALYKDVRRLTEHVMFF